jgi:hypothetical protein
MAGLGTEHISSAFSLLIYEFSHHRMALFRLLHQSPSDSGQTISLHSVNGLVFCKADVGPLMFRITAVWLTILTASDAVSLAKRFPTFRRNLVPQSLGVKQHIE